MDINTTSSNLLLVGDFNIDLLKLNSNNKFQEFYDTLSVLDLLPSITLPSRLSKRHATLIDNIYCKSPNPKSIIDSGILATQISDHMAVFAAFDFNTSTDYKSITEPSYIRSFTAEKMFHVLEELQKTNWSDIFDHSITADPQITYDDNLSKELERLIDKHFPLKQTKFNKYKHTRSKWMTYDLLKKIKERDKLYVDVNSLNCDQNVNALKVALLKNKTKED